MNHIILDVRESDEFEAEHIPNSIHVPLSCFESKAPAILNGLAGQKILLMCKGGKRAQIAADRIATFGLAATPSIEVYKGGIDEWKTQGKPTACAKAGHFPIMRQVQLIAGLLVLASTLASVFLNPHFVYVAMFVGTGLTVAGFSGFCLMAELLAKMPWNDNCAK